MRFRLALIVVVAALFGLHVPGLAQQPGQASGGQPGQTQPQTRTPARAPGRPGEQPAVGTAIIRGAIVTLDSGLPIRRAQVRLNATEQRDTRVATTDSQGRFEFRELPAGRYRISAAKAGFVTVEYGQRRPMQSGTPIEIRDGQLADRLTIGLPRGSVIAGRITDEFGEPIAEAQVSPLRWQRVAGTGRWMRTGPMVQTDDLGQYRLFGLAPGEYLVTATLRSGMYSMMNAQTEASTEANGFAPTYFPGVPSPAEATRLTVGVGEENGSASFALVATRLVAVEGTVISAQGTAVTQGMVQLIAADNGIEGGFMGPQDMARIDKNGRFKLSNIAPGRYTAQVRANGPMGPNGPVDTGEIGRTAVTVGSEKVDNVAIVMTAGGRVTGRVVTDSGVPLPAMPDNGFGTGPDAGRLRVMATPGTPFGGGNMGFGPGGNTAVQANGTFELRGLVDQRFLRVTTPPGWSVKAVLLGGRDYIDTPIDIEPGQIITGVEFVLTNRVSSVAGGVVDSRGQPATDATIIVFPEDEQYWKFASRHIRVARPDQEGRFRVENMPPHENYLAVAVQDMGEGQINDPAYLATIVPGAERFSLREGQGATVNLKLRQ